MNAKEATDFLIYCAKMGNLDGVRFAIQDGANPQSLGIALEEALRYQNFEVSDYLIIKGAALKLTKELLGLVVQQKSLPLAQYLKNKNVDILSFKEKLFIDFVYLGDIQALDYLISLGANYRADNDYPMRIACKTQNAELVAYFVDKGADIAASDYNALEIASDLPNTDILAYLITHHAKAWRWLLKNKKKIKLSDTVVLYIKERQKILQETAKIKKIIKLKPAGQHKIDKI